jgi:hypothetical protein
VYTSSIIHQKHIKIAVKKKILPSGKIVHTAGAIGDISHDKRLRSRELLDDVTKSCGKHRQA